MLLKNRLVTFPNMGRNTGIIKRGLERIGLEVILPNKINDETIKNGVKYSPQMMCLPYKICLGDYMSALNKGANTILAYDTVGTCRYRQYPVMHEHMLKGLGYNFDLYLATPNNIIRIMRELTGKGSIEVTKQILRTCREIQKEDKKNKTWSKDKPNIGLIGEIYCSCEDTVNCHLEDRIREYGANPYNMSRTGDFVFDKIPFLKLLNVFNRGDTLKKHKNEAKKYFNGPVGGHAFENIYNLLWLIENNVAGICHIMPLSCSPEAVISPYIDSICEENKMPLLRIPIDENNSEVNICTRLETFVELIKMRKER